MIRISEMWNVLIKYEQALNYLHKMYNYVNAILFVKLFPPQPADTSYMPMMWILRPDDTNGYGDEQ